MKIQILLIVTLYCAEVSAQLCHYRMPFPSGIVFYPLSEGQTKGHVAPEGWRKNETDICMMYMPLESDKTIKLIFRHVDVGENKILIETSQTKNNATWETLLIITGYEREVVIETSDINALRISTKKKAGRFMLFYQERFCEEPDPTIVIKKRCSRSFELYSICSFVCRVPYYPAMSANAKDFFTTCMQDKTWSRGMTEACSTYDEVIRNCLVLKNDLCEYTVEEIAEIVPEDDNIPLMHDSFDNLIFEARVQFLSTNVPHDSEGLANMPAFDNCHVHCLKTRSTDAFKFECKSDALTNDQKRDCILCRHSEDECKNHTLYT
ncbi:uncharacterized protein LOC120347354 [Styela clava]